MIYSFKQNFDDDEHNHEGSKSKCAVSTNWFYSLAVSNIVNSFTIQSKSNNSNNVSNKVYVFLSTWQYKMIINLFLPSVIGFLIVVLLTTFVHP